MELDIQGHRVLISKEDYELISKFSWRINAQGYAVANISMHRLISEPEKPLVVDHINRNKLDNRRDNLRNVTHAENRLNVDERGNGYSFYKRYGNWRVRLNGKHVGYYKTEEEAKLVVKNLRK